MVCSHLDLYFMTWTHLELHFLECRLLVLAERVTDPASLNLSCLCVLIDDSKGIGLALLGSISMGAHSVTQWTNLLMFFSFLVCARADLSRSRPISTHCIYPATTTIRHD